MVTGAICLTAVGCRSTFQNLVPPAVNGPSGAVLGAGAVNTWLGDGPNRPRIELWVNADSALAMLPRHRAGYVDWMGALRSGVIRPRAALPGEAPRAMAFQPAFEVLLRGPDSTTDAFFPHASHVQWLDCEQCHDPAPAAPVVPGYANVNMTDIIRGRFCGECHGKVAFPVTGQVETCERCHRRLLPEWVGLLMAEDGSPRRVSPHEAPSGRTLYRRWCAMCHGETGEGDGPIGEKLDPRPRDFTAALYQIRTTPNGELPLDEDLRRVIDEGIPGTAMPGWKNRLLDSERDSLVQFIKTLSPYFAGGEPPAITIVEAPDTMSIAAGRAVFDEMQCAKCHGEGGRGDGPSAAELTDEWGRSIRPADLTRRWLFNGGPRLSDIYTRLRTGMDGTPMPSYSDAVDAGVITDEQLWTLARYVRSLGREWGPLGDLEIPMRRIAGDPNIVAFNEVGVAGRIPTDDLPVARFPHWVHRIRYQCKTCHPALFVPRAGANAMTMIEINEGKACGRCHDGRTAFRAGFNDCQRCHVGSPAQSVAGLGGG